MLLEVKVSYFIKDTAVASGRESIPPLLLERTMTQADFASLTPSSMPRIIISNNQNGVATFNSLAVDNIRIPQVKYDEK